MAKSKDALDLNRRSRGLEVARDALRSRDAGVVKPPPGVSKKSGHAFLASQSRKSAGANQRRTRTSHPDIDIVASVKAMGLTLQNSGYDDLHKVMRGAMAGAAELHELDQ